MNKIHIEDEGGDTITFMHQHGIILPKGNPHAVGNLKNIHVRSDDIILAAFPKSGTHWVHEIIHLLISHSLNMTEVPKMQTMLESVPEADYRDLPSPRILNTHLLPSQLPADMFSKKVKIVLLLRNPRDVTVSTYNFLRKLPFCDYSGQWQNFYRPFIQGKFFYGPYLEYILNWENVANTDPALPILFLFYEDIKEKPEQETRRLCEFLGMDRSDEYIKSVCDFCDFDALTKTRASSEEAAYAYRKGQVGDWKNWFTVAQHEWFEEFIKEKMKDSKLKFRYNLN